MSIDLKIKKEDIPTLLAIFVLFPPEILDRVSDLLDNVQRYVQIACIVILAILVLKKIITKELVFKRSYLFWGAFCLYGFVLTLLNSPKNIYLFLAKVAVSIVIALLLCAYHQTDRVSVERLIRCFTWYWSILIVLNAVSMLVFPRGIVRSSDGATHVRANWIFGSKNNVVWPLLSGLTFVLLSYNSNTRGKRMAVLGLVSLIFLEMLCTGVKWARPFYGSSTTGMIVLIFAILLFLLRKQIPKTRLRYLMGAPNLFVAFFVLSTLMVCCAVFAAPIIGSIFVSLGKSASASGRTEVWLEAVSRIMEAPVFGGGYHTRQFLGVLSSAYNFFLDILVRYGLIGFALVFCAFLSYRTSLDDVLRDERCVIILIGLSCMFVCGLVNTINWEHLIVLLELFSSCALPCEAEEQPASLNELNEGTA